MISFHSIVAYLRTEGLAGLRFALVSRTLGRSRKPASAADDDTRGTQREVAVRFELHTSHRWVIQNSQGKELSALGAVKAEIIFPFLSLHYFIGFIALCWNMNLNLPFPASSRSMRRKPCLGNVTTTARSGVGAYQPGITKPSCRARLA